MRVALVHDWLTGMRGGEKCLEVFCELFPDADLFDGFTNRKGWTVYGSRQILPNTEFAVTLFFSDELRASTPDFERSVANADRIRLQTDIKVKF